MPGRGGSQGSTPSEKTEARMEALLEGLKSCEKEKTAYKVASEYCPEDSKASPEEIKAILATFEEKSGKMEAAVEETELEWSCRNSVREKSNSGHWRTNMRIDI
jgi:hypothetical protein